MRYYPIVIPPARSYPELTARHPGQQACQCAEPSRRREGMGKDEARSLPATYGPGSPVGAPPSVSLRSVQAQLSLGDVTPSTNIVPSPDLVHAPGHAPLGDFTPIPPTTLHPLKFVPWACLEWDYGFRDGVPLGEWNAVADCVYNARRRAANSEACRVLTGDARSECADALFAEEFAQCLKSCEMAERCPWPPADRGVIEYYAILTEQGKRRLEDIFPTGRLFWKICTKWKPVLKRDPLPRPWPRPRERRWF